MKSNNQQLLHHHHNQISSFNPTCCLRPPPSLLSDGQHGRHVSRTKDGTLPSPRIGCMGQVKRSSSYNSRRSSSSSNKNKLFQLRRMFSSSGKNTAMMMVSPRASTKVENHCCRQGISIADTMDLPLPVLKHRVADNVCSLWKRRRGGDGLQGLEIAQVKLQHVQHLRRSFSGVEKCEDLA